MTWSRSKGIQRQTVSDTLVIVHEQTRIKDQREEYIRLFTTLKADISLEKVDDSARRNAQLGTCGFSYAVQMSESYSIITYHRKWELLFVTNRAKLLRGHFRRPKLQSPRRAA